MANDDKNSNLIIFGIGAIAILFGYLIYLKSKESIPQPQPQQPQLQPQLQPQQSQQPQQIDSVELYKISEQLKLQTAQIKSIQEQQLQQTQNISQIESTKCSNVVSMSDGIYPSINNNIAKNIRLSNVKRENDELIADRIFGMK